MIPLNLVVLLLQWIIPGFIRALPARYKRPVDKAHEHMRVILTTRRSRGFSPTTPSPRFGALRGFHGRHSALRVVVLDSCGAESLT